MRGSASFVWQAMRGSASFVWHALPDRSVSSSRLLPAGSESRPYLPIPDSRFPIPTPDSRLPTPE
jgi:hypothetical protein